MNKKENKKRMKKYKLILSLSLLLLSGSFAQPNEAEAMTAAQSNSLINQYARRSANDYLIDGKFNYESFMSRNDENYNKTYYENGKGKWSDATPKNVGSSFYRPDNGPVGDIDMGNVADFGFTPKSAVWTNALLHNHGRPNRTSVDYMRGVKQTYQRMKTTPVIKSVGITGHAYKSGTNHWVKPGSTVQIKVFNTQSYPGKQTALDDYIKNNNVRLNGSGADARASMDYNGGFNYFKAYEQLTITKNSSARANGNRDLTTTFNVKANENNKEYKIESLATSVNGKEVGYVASGSYLKTDGNAPSGTLSPNSASWRKDNQTVVFNPSDVGSGVKRWRQRIWTNTDSWGAWSGYTNGDTNGNITLSANAQNKIQVQVEDNVGNSATINSETYYIDKSAPTGSISGNPTAWTNSNVTLSLTTADVGSGVNTIKKPDGSTVTGTSTTQVVTGNGNNSFVITDKVGNATTVSANVTKIDKTAPTLALSQTKTGVSVLISATGSDTGGSGVKSITLPNGSVVAGATGSQTVTVNGTYTFKVTDNAGNVTSQSIAVTNIDVTPPTGVITGNPTAWTNSNATLTINASDVGSGVKSIKKPDGVVVNGATTSFTVTQNGSYSFVVTDNAGNTATITASVTKIDKSLPTLEITQTPTAWTNGNVTLNATGSDTGGSGVKSITLPNGSVVAGATGSQVVTANGTYTFKVTDNAGNITSKTVTVTNIDKTAPAGTIAGNPTAWTNGNATLTLTASDVGSGVKSIKKPDGSVVNGTSASYVATANGNNSFVITDNAGNTTTVSANVTKIDKALPSLAITQTPTAWTNGNVTLNATGSDTGGSGVKSITLPNGTVTNGSTGSQVVTANGTYTFKVTDNAGNVTSKAISVTNIDKTAPTGVITGNPTAWTNGNATLTLTASDVGSGVKSIKKPDGSVVNGASTTFTATENGTYSFVITDNVGQTTTVSVSVTKIDKSLPTLAITQTPTAWTSGNVTLNATGSDTGGSGVKSITLPNGTVTNGSTGSQVVTANGTYTFKVTDNAGNITSKSVTVTNIDKTAPAGVITGNPTAWTNENATLTIKASDVGSGVKSIKKPDGSTVTGASTTHTVTANGTYSFVITDNVGQTTTVSVSVTKIDKSLPTLSLSQTPTAWTNGNVILNATGSDTGGAGVKSITLPNGTVTNGAAGSQTVTANGTYTFKVTDNAGNVTSKAISVTNIDKILPTLGKTEIKNVTQDSFDVYVNDVKDGESGINRVQFPTWTDAGGQDDLLSTWQTDAKASGTNMGNGTWKFTVQRSEHNYEFGHYTIHIYAYDNAGNRQSVAAHYELRDVVKPTINVTGNPTAWTGSSIVLTVSASDVHTGVKSITLPDGTVVVKNGAKGATVTHTYTITKNGSYTFTATDMYDNTISQTVSVTKIDLDSPDVTVTPSTTSWTNKDIILTAKATDSASGVKSIKLPNGSVVNSATATFTATKNGTYTFVLTDNVNNTRTTNFTVTNVDKVVPTEGTTIITK